MATNNYYWSQARNVTLATVRLGGERRTGEDQSQAESSSGAWTPEGYDNGGNNGATGPTGYGVNAVEYANDWAPELPPQPTRNPTFPSAYGSQGDYAPTLSSFAGTDGARGFDYLAGDGGFNNSTEDRAFKHSTEKKSLLSRMSKKKRSKTDNHVTTTPQDPLAGKLFPKPMPMRMGSSPSSLSGQSSSQFNPYLQSHPSWPYNPTLTSNSSSQSPVPQSTPQNVQYYDPAPAFAPHFCADPVEDTNLNNYGQARAGGHAYGMGMASPPSQHGPAGSGSVSDYRMSPCAHPKDVYDFPKLVDAMKS